jgi:hypothetical protein
MPYDPKKPTGKVKTNLELFDALRKNAKEENRAKITKIADLYRNRKITDNRTAYNLISKARLNEQESAEGSGEGIRNRGGEIPGEGADAIGHHHEKKTPEKASPGAENQDNRFGKRDYRQGESQGLRELQDRDPREHQRRERQRDG